MSVHSAWIIALASLMTGPIPAAPARADQPTSKPAPGIVGIWLGTVEAGGERIRVVLKISKNADGALIATMDSPDRGLKDLPVTQIRWQDSDLHLEVPSRAAVFDGELSKDGEELMGSWRQSGMTLPLKLRQVEPEAVVTPFPAGVYLAAVITSFFALWIIGSFIFTQTPRKDWRFFAAVVAVHLPMWAIAFYWVRLPLKGWLAATLGEDSAVFAFLDTLFAPVTEELAKLWLLLVPWFARRLHRENAPHLGMAIGLGFGLGEAWVFGWWLSTDPAFAGLPWYSFGTLGGYMAERFMVCIHHGALTAAALRTIRQAPLRSILFAMSLHFIGNFPVALRAWNFGGLGEPAWSIIVQIWLILFFCAMIALLSRFFKSADPAGRWSLRHVLLGKAKCPECGRSWFGINMGSRRYERCPGCKKWHLSTKWKGEALPETRA